MDNTMKTITAILCISLFVSYNAYGDELKDLFEAKTLVCSYGEGTTGEWSNGAVKLEQDNFGKQNTITISSIDYKKSAAKIVGSGGTFPLMAIINQSGAHFIEQTGTHNLIYRTVFFKYVDNTRKLSSVMSRHVSMMTTPLPSQYLGSCSASRY
jgi:hypothetical protein